MAQVPKRVQERFSKEIGRYQRILQSAKDRDVNESDTGVIVASRGRGREVSTMTI